ncbi:ABC transporter permease/substrate-binding protein [Bifidobacterium lemurum]|nr:ABC transporter permease/substrate-binding protein [Bifidobacterium lemurum]
MDVIQSFVVVFLERREELASLLLEHMQMTSSAVLLSLIIGVPLGLAITGSKGWSTFVIGLANITQSIPSLGLLAFLVPIVGIGKPSAVLMVIVYALLPIVKNTYIGITSIDQSTIESARGIGLSDGRIMLKIKLPLAIATIMGGVRISAVTAVGTVTIGAFAGAGGLGWMINLGLNANDVNLVLLGAIPACMLALAVDAVLAMVERILTPEGLKSPDKIVHLSKPHRVLRTAAAAIAAFAVLVAPLLSMIPEAVGHDDEIVVGSENFTEALILGNIYSQLIQRNTNLKVDEKFNLDGTLVTMNAFDSGDIDMFTDYTGVLAPNVLDLDVSTDVDQVYEEVRDGMAQNHGAKVSLPLGFSNTYVLAMSREASERTGITTLSELVEQSGTLRLGCTVAFSQRPDLLPKMESELGVAFLSVEGLEGNIRYQAIASGQIDVTDAYETDAMVKKMDLVELEDDIAFFPPYQAISIARSDTLATYPELEPLMAKLEGAISGEDMMEMNYQVDIEGRTPRDVAVEFLQSKGLA